MRWVKYSDRMPTEADGDNAGDVVIRKTFEGGRLDVCYMPWDDDPDCYTEWLEGAGDDLREPAKAGDVVEVRVAVAVSRGGNATAAAVYEFLDSDPEDDDERAVARAADLFDALFKGSPDDVWISTIRGPIRPPHKPLEVAGEVE